jgi:hypothetical protein
MPRYKKSKKFPKKFFLVFALVIFLPIIIFALNNKTNLQGDAAGYGLVFSGPIEVINSSPASYKCVIKGSSYLYTSKSQYVKYKFSLYKYYSTGNQLVFVAGSDVKRVYIEKGTKKWINKEWANNKAGNYKVKLWVSNQDGTAQITKISTDYANLSFNRCPSN